jgi:hypothetical protein
VLPTIILSMTSHLFKSMNSTVIANDMVVMVAHRIRSNQSMVCSLSICRTIFTKVRAQGLDTLDHPMTSMRPTCSQGCQANGRKWLIHMNPPHQVLDPTIWFLCHVFCQLTLKNGWIPHKCLLLTRQKYRGLLILAFFLWICWTLFSLIVFAGILQVQSLFDNGGYGLSQCILHRTACILLTHRRPDGSVDHSQILWIHSMTT